MNTTLLPAPVRPAVDRRGHHQHKVAAALLRRGFRYAETGEHLNTARPCATGRELAPGLTSALVIAEWASEAPLSPRQIKGLRLQDGAGYTQRETAKILRVSPRMWQYQRTAALCSLAARYYGECQHPQQPPWAPPETAPALSPVS